MFALALTFAMTSTPTAGTAHLTLGDETTVHQIAACALTPEGAMPARLLIEDTDVTVIVSRADHVQIISVIRNDKNWTTTRMNMGGKWVDRGQPAEPIVKEWGTLIRAEATLSDTGNSGERQVSVVARC